MKIKLIATFVCLCSASAFADGEWFCFKNGGLRDNFILRFQIEGAKVSGTYTIERGYGADGTEEYEFSGTKAGGILSVKFDKTLPEEDGAKVSRLEMTIRQAGDGQALKAKAFGAGKKLLGTDDYEACEPGFGKLSKEAERISFAKGEMTVERSITLERQNHRIAFLMNLPKGRDLAIHAPGAGISYFDPAKRRYEEGTAIDDLTLRNSKAGDYLFVFSPAGEAHQCTVTFTVTDGANSQ